MHALDLDHALVLELLLVRPRDPGPAPGRSPPRRLYPALAPDPALVPARVRVLGLFPRRLLSLAPCSSSCRHERRCTACVLEERRLPLPLLRQEPKLWPQLQPQPQPEIEIETGLETETESFPSSPPHLHSLRPPVARPVPPLLLHIQLRAPCLAYLHQAAPLDENPTHHLSHCCV